MKKQTYIQGAFILTLTNLITGMLAFVYRIFLSRTIGSEGVGVYQLILPFYNLLITLVSGGVSTAVSKLTSEQYTRKKYKNMLKIINVCCIIVSLWSIMLSLSVALNADFLSKNILRDNRTMYSIIICSPAVVFISIAAVLKGYFYGIQDVKPPAFIDVIEKIVRLGTLLIATYFLMPYGVEYVCAGAMIAMTFGELMSVVLLIAVYKHSKRKITIQGNTSSSISIISNILKLALPLSISGALNTIMDMAIAVMIPSKLTMAGYTHEKALSLYGELTGMVMPLIFFPFIIVSSLGVTLVPAIASSYTAHNWDALNKKCNDAFKITTVIGLGSTAVFAIFPYDLCDIFFKCGHAGSLLLWMSIGCLFEYWQFILFSMMNAVGLQNEVLKNSILNIFITVGFIYILTPIPTIGIYGYIIGFNISAVIITMLNFSTLKKIPHIKISIINNIIKPLICVAGMAILLVFLESINMNLITSIFISLLVFFILLIISNTFTLKQIKTTIKR